MNFFSRLKYSMGFGDYPETEDLQDDDEPTVTAEPETVTAPEESQHTEEQTDAPEQTEQPEPEQTAEPAGAIHPAAAAVLAGVVKYFNATLPDFVARHLDSEAQRQFLLEALDSDIRAMLANAAEEAAAQARHREETERNKLTGNLEELRKQCQKLEELRDKLKNDQLSARRQKNALEARVHDLEKQVETMAAEREQLTLENRGMANRLRVLDVTGGAETDAAATEELLKLKNEVDELRGAVADKDKEIARLSEAAGAQQPEQTGESEALAEANGALAEARARINRLEKSIDEADDRYNERANALNTKISAVEKERDRYRMELIKTRGELEKQDEKIDELRRNSKPEARESKYKEQLNDAQHRITKLETAAADYERGAAKAIEDLNAARAEAASLREELANTKARHASEIERLRDESATPAPPKKRGRPRKNPLPEADTHMAEITIEPVAVTPTAIPASEQNPAQAAEPELVIAAPAVSPKLSAIDDVIDTPEWLEAPAPDETPVDKTPKTDDPDFGYKAPAKSTHQPSVNQLSLF